MKLRLASTAAVGELSLFKTAEVYPLELAMLKGIKWTEVPSPTQSLNEISEKKGQKWNEQMTFF